MKSFSTAQQTLFKKQGKQLKKDLKFLKAKLKTKKKSKTFGKPKEGSSGERLIAKYLVANNHIFIKEHPIPEISKHKDFPLRFDFYLPELLIAIEFDGEQHFKPSKLFDTKTCTLASRQEKDRLKDMYCTTKGIEMIRINYYDIRNISSILDERIR